MYNSVVLPGSHKLYSSTRYITLTVTVTAAPGHFQISDLTSTSGFGGYGEEYKVHPGVQTSSSSGAQLGADVSSLVSTRAQVSG